ncbi:uncharacterized protein LOC125859246 [Solanum stenotomum]|uniref:uncharacterized protein LOC125859246 n=1 Tax=Solanum stenotomum TaxID=172797 RepID=UPI0020D0CDE0|nr:uncharacterized protein LOC125859246 [Solanum stenotomum]
MGLVDTIKDNNQASNQERAKAMIFLRHHLDEGLKMQYLTIKNPLILWNNLKDRYDHLKLVILPQARHDWFNLRLLDFKSITEYNSSMYRIISQLNLCGEEVTEHDKLEKTYSTFPASSMLLQQQYREMDFKKYSELLSHVLIVVRHNDLLIKNHESRPVGSMPLPEVNRQIITNEKEVVTPIVVVAMVMMVVLHQKTDQQYKRKGERQEVIQKKNSKSVCHRCGRMLRTCRSSKRLVQLYQASLKKGDNNLEANFVSEDNVELIHKMNNNAEANFISEDNAEPMHLDVAAFFVFPEGKMISEISDDPMII